MGEIDLENGSIWLLFLPPDDKSLSGRPSRLRSSGLDRIYCELIVQFHAEIGCDGRRYLTYLPLADGILTHITSQIVT